MNRMNLVLHCGAHRASYEDVERVETPQPTKTHHPIPHNRFVDLVRHSMGRGGFEITNEEHALDHHGSRYFGLFQVNPAIGTDGASLLGDLDPNDYATVIGVRNSHDKTFPAGGVCGSGVFVCDNLAMSGEVQIKRKHTRYIMNDLPGLVDGMVGRLLGLRQTQAQRIDAYKNTEITQTAAQSLMIDSLRADVVCASKMSQVVKEWDAPSHPEFAQNGRTVWRLFNAFTEVLKSRGRIFDRPRWTMALHGLCDSVSGVKPVETIAA